MNISRNYRWNVPSGFQDEIKQAFERLFNPEEADQSNVVTSQWTPRVDIREEDKRFVILADVPASIRPRSRSRWTRGFCRSGANARTTPPSRTAS